jgi:hypothetical protein
MKKLRNEFSQGWKEGWQLFWSPLTGFLKAAKKVISGALK